MYNVYRSRLFFLYFYLFDKFLNIHDIFSKCLRFSKKMFLVCVFHNTQKEGVYRMNYATSCWHHTLAACRIRKVRSYKNCFMCYWQRFHNQICFICNRFSWELLTLNIDFCLIKYFHFNTHDYESFSWDYLILMSLIPWCF